MEHVLGTAFQPRPARIRHHRHRHAIRGTHCARMRAVVGVDAVAAVLRHMAMFALGVALAKRLTDNGRETMRDVVAVPLALCGIVLVCQSGFGLLPGIVAQPLAVCGCLILVVVALTCNVVSDLLSTPPVRWLGRISFSLYLTHLPVRDWIVPYIPVQGLLRPVVLFALCLLAAEAFYLAVERPATRLSRRLGKVKREA